MECEVQAILYANYNVFSLDILHMVLGNVTHL